MGELLKRARSRISEGYINSGSLSYINVQLQYYGIAGPENLSSISDSEYMLRLAILEDIKKREHNNIASSEGIYI